jgi:hypothetical protein
MSTNPLKDVVEVASHDLLAAVQILNAFAYESDEDSCEGMSFFTARLNEDGFFRIKSKLEAILKSSANAGVNNHPNQPTMTRPCYGCSELFHPDDMHTIDITKYGEHDTAEICDGCKEGHADTPRIADIDLDTLNLNENDKVMPSFSQVEVSVDSVGLHFDKEGITAMVRMNEAVDADEVEDILIEWDELFGWAQASSQDEGDCEAICAGLRELADKLQAWNEG